ncbi:FecR family protein [Vacuolonema iberomarrocanum]|uniref:FecR family protein n=1 Tax=Vacuolonema iberomarrocanum TaxID=3454632 RepID=UPI001A026B9F|nr:FecR domain-containing protein [filamentous cyanobacterium LEGE 07170]
MTVLVSTTLLLGAGFSSIAAAQTSGRWLEVSRISGSVTYQRSGSRAARVGDRLEAPGHGVSTADRASTTLALDTAIGSINVAANTEVWIQQLAIASDGGRITILDVPRGQARIQVRTFTNPSSRLELHTPSGVAAVRGTDFGIIVSDDGRTAIGTDEGAVEASAQGVRVIVEPDFASVIRPGEPPSEPQPLDRELALQVVNLTRRGDQINLEGRINPTNQLLFNGEDVPVRRTGYFRTSVSLPPLRRLELTVQNPLGEERTYRFPSWRVDDPDRN